MLRYGGNFNGIYFLGLTVSIRTYRYFFHIELAKTQYLAEDHFLVALLAAERIPIERQLL